MKTKNQDLIKSLEEIQKQLDEIHSEGEWLIVEYNGRNHPCLLKHKCGRTKFISLGSYLKSSRKMRCEVCTSTKTTENQNEYYNKIRTKKVDFQKEIDEMYGEGVWTIKEYEGTTKPSVLVHSCGLEKRVARARNVRKACRCDCELTKNGREINV